MAPVSEDYDNSAENTGDPLTLSQIKDDFIFMNSWVCITKLYLACMLLTTGLFCSDYITRAICSMMYCIVSFICYVTFYDKLMILYDIKEISNDNNTIWMKYSIGITVKIILFGIATFQEIVAWSGDPVVRPIFQVPNNTPVDEDDGKQKDD